LNFDFKKQSLIYTPQCRASLHRQRHRHPAGIYLFTTSSY